MVNGESFGERARKRGARVEGIQVGAVDVGATARSAFAHPGTPTARFCCTAASTRAVQLRSAGPIPAPSWCSQSA